ncbi:MAG: serine hydrolase [Gordonia sp. (in: high G+C Gram-positive bacteria)]|uniref:serine hydrolase domain-containing protein n=1 Tax=Gordonia sp. (in: high G+C Gram-positive bacteria) TaxID=84139 RepID=UPI0039E4C487
MTNEKTPAETTPAGAKPAGRWKKPLTIVLVVILALVGTLYAATAAIGVPFPHELYRLQTTAPSQQGTVFPTRPVVNTGAVREWEAAAGLSLPATVPWKGGEVPVADMLGKTNSRAFVVVQDGKLVDEWYADGVTADSRLSSWSVAKSVISLMIGQAIERGDLSETDKMVDILPEFRTGGGDYDEITVRDLLDMASGIDVSENYNPWWPLNGTARLLLSTDLPGYLMKHRAVSFTPGEKAVYRSVDTQMLGMILAKVNGEPVARVVSEGLWTPMGAEAEAEWNLDTENGTEKSFCCLNATARDFARIGQTVASGGMVDGKQVISPEWITRISTPSNLPMNADWGYSAQWWHPAPLGHNDFTALGVYGQYIYINPDTRTVIVKLSDHGTEQDELDTIGAMRAISEHLGKK